MLGEVRLSGWRWGVNVSVGMSHEWWPPPLVLFEHDSQIPPWARGVTPTPTYLFKLRVMSPSLPTYLPSFLPSYLPAFLHACLPSYLPTCLPSFLGFARALELLFAYESGREGGRAHTEIPFYVIKLALLSCTCIFGLVCCSTTSFLLLPYGLP